MYYLLTSPGTGMYLEQKLTPSSAEYTLNFGLVIKGAGENEINSAMSEIFTRHESLRSFYSEDNGVSVRVTGYKIPDRSVILHRKTA